MRAACSLLARGWGGRWRRLGELLWWRALVAASICAQQSARTPFEAGVSTAATALCAARQALAQLVDGLPLPSSSGLRRHALTAHDVVRLLSRPQRRLHLQGEEGDQQQQVPLHLGQGLPPARQQWRRACQVPQEPAAERDRWPVPRDALPEPGLECAAPPRSLQRQLGHCWSRLSAIGMPRFELARSDIYKLLAAQARGSLAYSPGHLRFA